MLDRQVEGVERAVDRARLDAEVARARRCPLLLSWGTIRLAVSIGTAKPMPTLPLRRRRRCAICELMPMTRPAASISGPPELPGLIAASVWMTLSIWKPSGAVDRALRAPRRRRSSACAPGRTGCRSRSSGRRPATSLEEPSVSGSQVEALGVDLQQREVGRAVAADHLRPSTVLLVGELHASPCAAPSTTWAFVRIVAVAVDDEARAGRLARAARWPQVERRLRPAGRPAARMKTTPGASRL